MATSNAGRERILGRIRKSHVSLNVSDMPGSAEVFSPIGNPMERFLRECEGNLTHVHRTANAAESAKVLAEVLSEIPPGSLYVEDDPALRAMQACFGERTVLWSSDDRAPDDCAASLTLCDALVAQTGSILTSSRHGGRGGSIVAPVHIVFATSDQLVAEISTALRKAMAGGMASYVGLISGSSRTADIEKILVQGAHGPVCVDIILEQR